MKKICIEGELVEQIKYSTNNELVSSDIVGTPSPSMTVMPQSFLMTAKYDASGNNEYQSAAISEIYCK
jgi:hypothetical protein